MTRVISIWLPTFATDRLTRIRNASCAAQADRAFATTEAVAGARRLAAVNGAAAGAGLAPGLPLADARAVVPDLAVAESEPAADLRALRALARWCGRWTPTVAVEGLSGTGGAGLWLDVTGCAHLFGGETALLESVRDRLAALGLTVRVGMADTPGAAWAAARFLDGVPDGGAALIPPGAQRQLLGGLPVAALRLPPPARETLGRLGLRTLDDLLRRPRAPLSRRLGPEVWRRLDQLLGHAPEPLAPLRPAVAHRVRIAFAEPIGRTEDVAAALDDLLARLCGVMDQAGRGVRRLDLTVYRVDGTVTRARIGTGRPSRDPAHLARLFRERLDGLDAGFGIEVMGLDATRHQPMTPAQTTLAAETGADGARDSLPRLIDRLVERCGADNVVRLSAWRSHRPERAQRAVAPDAPQAAQDWPAHRAPRPVRLLRRPVPVIPPTEAGRTIPERIGGEWWQGPAGGEVVDLLRVEDPDGARAWIARDRVGWTKRGVFP
ncbi:Y-family DNA polymerase [Roseospira navarrensis]|uniref:DNA-directed DNA polymerase n=1 Tax=Roseospira navarrensis TaxID=140058 RepID=A0A7X1ZBS9_9PROT|nr:DNA polymerase Y family protein [Roseospira navarrensis]MQX35638.1 DNA polymerase Y family protein [Roseospira navarrensis]